MNNSTLNDKLIIERGYSLGADSWDRLKRNKISIFSLWFFITMLIICFILPLFPFILNPNTTNLELQSLPPFSKSVLKNNQTIYYIMGSDHLGRDLLSRILHGGRISLLVGILATLVSLTIGVIYGSISGYCGKRVDSIMMRVVDILYALPFMIIVIILTTYFGNKLWLLFICIGAVEWLTMSRIVRGQVISLKKEDFVYAAKSLGISKFKILFAHIIPNAIGPIIIYATLTVPSVMRLESVLSFLGLGVQPPHASWGSLIKEGADRMTSDFGLLLYPSIIFGLTLFSLNFLGDGIRDALDPKSRKNK